MISEQANCFSVGLTNSPILFWVFCFLLYADTRSQRPYVGVRAKAEAHPFHATSIVRNDRESREIFLPPHQMYKCLAL